MLDWRTGHPLKEILHLVLWLKEKQFSGIHFIWPSDMSAFEWQTCSCQGCPSRSLLAGKNHNPCWMKHFNGQIGTPERHSKCHSSETKASEVVSEKWDFSSYNSWFTCSRFVCIIIEESSSRILHKNSVRRCRRYSPMADWSSVRLPSVSSE